MADFLPFGRSISALSSVSKRPAGPSLLDNTRRHSLAHAFLAVVREPLVVLDNALRISAASKSFYALFQMDAAEALGQPFCELPAGRWDIPSLRLLFQDVIAGNELMEAYAFEIEPAGSVTRYILLNACQVVDPNTSDVAVLVGFEDVTAKREAEGLKDTLLRQKEVLLFEIQHRVANSLQIIASILLMKVRSAQSDETRFHLHDMHQRVMSIATVQRQLRNSGLVNEVEFGSYLAELCEGLANSMVSDDRGVTIKSSASAGRIKADDAVNLGLIVTELVINALKHGFANGRHGHIDVSFVRDGPVWSLSVSDNGIGRARVAVEPGHIGLGTRIVEALARQLKATVHTADGNPGTSTSVRHTGQASTA